MQTIAGVEVHEEGRGNEAIVMIHGWPDTYRLWDAQVEALRSDYRCIRFTLPGFDQTTAHRAYSLDETINIIHQIVETTCPEQSVTLMTHDWGCLFGYQFVMLHPSLVSRIVGLDIGDAGSRAHMDSLGIKAKLMTFGYQSWLAAAWRIGGGVGDRMTRFMARQMQVPGDVSKIGSYMNYPYYIRWTGAHGSYRAARTFKPSIPMLFVYGTKKPFMFHSPRWAKLVNSGEHSGVVAMDAGHWVMRDAPEKFNEILKAWLAQSMPTPSKRKDTAHA